MAKLSVSRDPSEFMLIWSSRNKETRSDRFCSLTFIWKPWFHSVHITEDLTWSAHTDAVLKKAHQRLFFLRRLRKFETSPSVLRSFYTCTVESILTGCITAWFGNSTAGNRKALQRVVRTACHIVGGELPSLQDIYTRRCIRKAKDSSHPSALSAALRKTSP